MWSAGMSVAGVLEWHDGDSNLAMAGGGACFWSEGEIFGLTDADDEGTAGMRAEALQGFAGEQEGFTAAFEINAGGAAVGLEAERVINDDVIKADRFILYCEARGRGAYGGASAGMSVVLNECNGAKGDRIVTEFGHRDAIMIAAAGQGMQTNDLLYDRENEIATGFDDTAAEDNHIGVEQMADVEAGVAERFGGFADDLSDELVFLLEGAFQHAAFDDGEVITGEFGDGAFAAVVNGIADVAFDGGAAGEGFETAAVATAAEGAAGLHDHVADFAGGIAAAGDELAVDDEAGADAGTDKDADGGGSAAGGAAPSFTEGAEIDIIADIDRDFEAVAEEGCDDHA